MSDLAVVLVIAAYVFGCWVCYRWGRQSGDLRAYDATYERDEARSLANFWQKRAAAQDTSGDPCDVCADSPLTCPPGSPSECYGILPEYPEDVTP